jgi:hypothetical protein
MAARSDKVVRSENDGGMERDKNRKNPSNYEGFILTGCEEGKGGLEKGEL